MGVGHGVGPRIKPVVAVAPIAADSAQTSAAIDRHGYYSATLFVPNGAATGTPSSYTVNAKVQECDTSDGEFADVAGLTTPEIDANAENGELDIDLRSRKRYLKVVVTPALSGGSSPKALISAILVLGDPNREPV